MRLHDQGVDEVTTARKPTDSGGFTVLLVRLSNALHPSPAERKKRCNLSLPAARCVGHLLLVAATELASCCPPAALKDPALPLVVSFSASLSGNFLTSWTFALQFRTISLQHDAQLSRIASESSSSATSPKFGPPSALAGLTAQRSRVRWEGPRTETLREAGSIERFPQVLIIILMILIAAQGLEQSSESPVVAGQR
ncbi:hypothetical protein PVAR5_1402 [Paecilomyces variotii No. 5]|uniref:Uncharacterized protein n=1 Tax=Byssochlamys spectabilis (strain No. 5 / NBRC 109023) TaxID=1356009 RepID=V5FSY6_BYSSN|nr:hypothetical protein PVAR5_1402 [Paecilomyces variotii No. 5]